MPTAPTAPTTMRGEQMALAEPLSHPEPSYSSTPRISTRETLVRSLPLIAMGGVLALGITSPGGVVNGIILIGAEVALGATAVLVWFPFRNKKQ